MSAVPRRHLVENRICEAKRLSRAAQLHKQRLESIAAGRQHRPLYDGPPQPPLPARRRNPRLEAERALGDKLHAANLRRIGSRPGGIAELQHRTTPREEVSQPLVAMPLLHSLLDLPALWCTGWSVQFTEGRRATAQTSDPDQRARECDSRAACAHRRSSFRVRLDHPGAAEQAAAAPHLRLARGGRVGRRWRGMTPQK